MVLCGTASCVQDFDDSQNSAIHITYRISLRSSSSSEPRYPLLKVFFFVIDILVFFSFSYEKKKSFKDIKKKMKNHLVVSRLKDLNLYTEC